jgi:bifunctional aspartokinase / homoserine dehydrogenase 1
MRTLTMKFGGTSVGSATAFRQAADIVLEQATAWDRVVVVVSAMSGVTDALVRGARTAAEGDKKAYGSIVAELRARHQEAVGSLFSVNGDGPALIAGLDRVLDEFAVFCRSVYVLREVTPRTMDAISSLGERLSAGILATLLNGMGWPSQAVDARELIVTDDTFQGAVPLLDQTRAATARRLLPLLEQGIVPVVTGFVGANREGVTTTLGRGGSDFSAAILGIALASDEVWIWTDVDGVLSADPRLVPEARLIPSLSYAEVGELAYFGAKVLHPRTIRPVVERGIPLWVKNTFNPACPGTRVVAGHESTPGAIKAVTAIEDLSMVTVEGRGMLGVPGIAARTFAAVAGQGASVLMISQASSEQSICFVIPTAAVPSVVRAVEREMSLELGRRDIDRVWSLDGVTIVTAVGAGMRTTPGVAYRIFGALAGAEINVIAVAQGSSECSISLLLNAADARQAVRHIHKEVIET